MRTDQEIAGELRPAGLMFVGRIDGAVATPVPADVIPATLPEGTGGRIDGPAEDRVRVDDPDLAAKVNIGWYRLAAEHGLFGATREFLLRVNYADPDAEADLRWVRVRLLDGWDIAGAGATALRSWMARLFTAEYVPEFTALSLDGRTMTSTTVWQDATVATIAVVRPNRED